MPAIMNDFLKSLLKYDASAKCVHTLPIVTCYPEYAQLPALERVVRQYRGLGITPMNDALWLRARTLEEVEGMIDTIDCSPLLSIRRNPGIEDRYMGDYDFFTIFKAAGLIHHRLPTMDEFWSVYMDNNRKAFESYCEKNSENSKALLKPLEKRAKLGYAALVRELYTLLQLAQYDGWRVFTHPLVDYAAGIDGIVVPPNYAEAGCTGLRIMLHSYKSFSYASRKRQDLNLVSKLHQVGPFVIKPSGDMKESGRIITASDRQVRSIMRAIELGIDSVEECITGFSPTVKLYTEV